MYQRRRKRLLAEMNVVPYIDVMLVLLIIFMVTSPMLSLTQGVEVELPQVASESVSEDAQEPIIVSLNVAGSLYLTHDQSGETELSREVLLPRVAALLHNQPRRPVLVRADTAVSHGEVVKLMATLQAAGVAKVGLMTKPPQADANPRPVPANAAGGQ